MAEVLVERMVVKLAPWMADTTAATLADQMVLMMVANWVALKVGTKDHQEAARSALKKEVRMAVPSGPLRAVLTAAGLVALRAMQLAG